jgi:hypothetical protein
VRVSEQLRQPGVLLVQPQTHPCPSSTLIQHGIDPLAGTAGVFEPLQHQDDGRITRSLPVRRQDGGSRRGMHRLAAQIDGTDKGRVQLTGTQPAQGNLQGADAGKLLGGDGKSGTTQVKLDVDPVGGDVRHRANDHGSIGRSGKGLAGLRHPVIRQPRRPAGNAQPGRAPGGLGVAGHTDEDASAPTRQAHPGARRQGGPQQQQLLRQSCLEVTRRKGHRGGVEDHLADPPGHRARRCVAEQQGGKRATIRASPGLHRQTDKRHRNGSRPRRGRRRHDTARLPLLDHQMGVGPTEAEGADRSPPQPLRRPRLRFVQHPERRPQHLVADRPGVQRRRPHPHLQRLQHLHQPRRAGSRGQVPQVGL